MTIQAKIVLEREPDDPDVALRFDFDDARQIRASAEVQDGALCLVGSKGDGVIGVSGIRRLEHLAIGAPSKVDLISRHGLRGSMLDGLPGLGDGPSIGIGAIGRHVEGPLGEGIGGACAGASTRTSAGAPTRTSAHTSASTSASTSAAAPTHTSTRTSASTSAGAPTRTSTRTFTGTSTRTTAFAR